MVVRDVSEARVRTLFVMPTIIFMCASFSLVLTCAVPKYTALEIVPTFCVGCAVMSAFALYLWYRRQWSVCQLSAAAALCVALGPSASLLGAFTRAEPSLQPARLSNGTLLWTVVPGEFADSDPGPFVMTLVVSSWVGSPNSSMFPLRARDAWALFAVPAAWLVANAAIAQPVARFVKVALLHLLFPLQVT